MEKPTSLNELTPREKEVAELLAWGATKKEAAENLFLSTFTIDNHLRKIFDKTGCNKVNELSAWWFCTRFKISFDLSPLKRSIMAGALILALIPGDFYQYHNITRSRSQRASTAIRITQRFTSRRELQI